MGAGEEFSFRASGIDSEHVVGRLPLRKLTREHAVGQLPQQKSPGGLVVDRLLQPKSLDRLAKPQFRRARPFGRPPRGATASSHAGQRM
jgi:hypothetical protein